MNNSQCDYMTIRTGSKEGLGGTMFSQSFTKSLECTTLLSSKNRGWVGGQKLFHCVDFYPGSIGNHNV